MRETILMAMVTEVNDEDIQHILELSSLGTAHWCQQIESSKEGSRLLDEDYIVVEKESGEQRRLTKGKLQKGIKLFMYHNGPEYFQQKRIRGCAHIDLEKIGEKQVDAMIQLALFEEIRFQRKGK